MKRIQIVVIAAGIAFTSYTAHASKYLIGSGGGTCGVWTKATASQKVQKMAWVLGYLSGINYVAEPDILKSPDAPAIESWMDNYCHTHPLDTISKAASDLALELVKRATDANANQK